MSIMNVIKSSAERNVDLLTIDISNCPDPVWTKKIGGDYYWQHIVHALMSLQMFFIVPGGEKVKPMVPPVDPAAISLRQGAPGPVPTKAQMLDLSKQAKTFINDYFSKVKEVDLDKIVHIDFMNADMPLSAVLILECNHLFYHLGTCDSLLRDNGAKGAL